MHAHVDDLFYLWYYTYMSSSPEHRECERESVDSIDVFALLQNMAKVQVEKVSDKGKTTFSDVVFQTELNVGGGFVFVANEDTRIRTTTVDKIYKISPHEFVVHTRNSTYRITILDSESKKKEGASQQQSQFTIGGILTAVRRRFGF